MQILYSLPRPQQATAKALKQLEAALLLLLPSTAGSDFSLPDSAQSATGVCQSPLRTQEESLRLLRLTVSFVSLLGRMADNYQLEKNAFLKQLQESHVAIDGHDSVTGAELHSPAGADGHSPATSDAGQTAKRPRISTGHHQYHLVLCICCLMHAVFQSLSPDVMHLLLDVCCFSVIATCCSAFTA